MTTASRLQEQLQIVLQMFVPCRGSIHVAVGGGSATHVFQQRTDQIRRHVLPAWLVAELKFVEPDSMRTSFCSADDGGQGLLDAAAVWAELPLEPEATAASASTRLAAFPLPPTLTLHMAWTRLVAWQLEQPAPLDIGLTRSRVERVQRSLAELLGGLTDAVNVSVSGGRYQSIPAWHHARPAVRLPGSRVHGRGPSQPVILVDSNDRARYSLDDLEAALATATHTAPRSRRQRQEIA